MPIKRNPTRADKAERTIRAQEWKSFRQTFTYSQTDLARLLGCSRRTLQGIESGREQITPRAALLRKFRAVRLEHEAVMKKVQGEVA
jgi:DNA-binding XRE family transcriptional regulator